MGNNTKQKTITLALSGMFAAIIFAATALLHIPLPGNGYANFGDCFILIAAAALNPVFAFLSAGIGSALSDVVLGYFGYAPATFIIKGLMALAFCLLFRRTKARNPIWFLIFGFLSEVIMVLGYLLFEWPLYGFGAALINVGPNALQGLVGLVSAFLIYGILKKT